LWLAYIAQPLKTSLKQLSQEIPSFSWT